MRFFAPSFRSESHVDFTYYPFSIGKIFIISIIEPLNQIINHKSNLKIVLIVYYSNSLPKFLSLSSLKF